MSEKVQVWRDNTTGVFEDYWREYQPMYGGKYGIMYVHTAEDEMGDQSDWRLLNISTMPRDDM